MVGDRKCPNCGSTDIKFCAGDKRLGVDECYLCNKCNQLFKEGE